MKIRSGERGESNLGCFLWVLVLLVVAVFLYKTIPVQIAKAEFYDFMIEQAKFGANRSAIDIKKRVLEKARELDLPVTDKMITVEKTRDRVRIRCTYTVPIEFPGGFVWERTFSHDVDRPIFFL